MSDPADLSNLRDIVVPPDVPLWPPAPGWWIVGAAIVASAAVLAGMAAVRYRRNAYRRAALGELAAVEDLPAGEAAQRVTAVLKRAALVAYPRAEVAELSGQAWLGFLDRTGRTDAFTTGPARELPSLAYGGRRGASDLPAIVSAARAWVRRHRC
jgi:hypothetical protein